MEEEAYVMGIHNSGFVVFMPSSGIEIEGLIKTKECRGYRARLRHTIVELCFVCAGERWEAVEFGVV
ncbi:hypothetical protein BDZ91DRAFT_711469 [Kalaharituber pfeilii]|nr:hypothetical protein BDZ91DRAFT_711469 [Kalaharituber pfeilii]